MYAVQSGTNGILKSISTPKTYKAMDQYVNLEEMTLHDMNPLMDPQVYIYASTVSCRECSDIQSNTCSGPVIPVTG